MKPTALPWIAAVSAFFAIVMLQAEGRPRYGGMLRVEMAASLNNLDPAEIPRDPVALEAKARLAPAVFETLVRLDQSGKPLPWLATSWTL